MKGEGKSRDFRYIALDIHKYYSVVAGVNREGRNPASLPGGAF